MSVVEAKIQTVEDMYRLIWTAIAQKQPISAIYKEKTFRGCFALTGWAGIVWASLACCAISTVARARAVWGRWGRRRIGVASFSKSCGRESC